MRAYRRTKLYIVSILAGISLVCFFVVPLLGKKEVYPFFRWELFAHVTPLTAQFFIQIRAVDGRKLETPCWLPDCAASIPRLNRSSVYWPIQNFGRAWHAGDPQAELLRKRLEDTFSEGRRMDYSLYSRELNAIDFIRSGQVLAEKHLADFIAE